MGSPSSRRAWIEIPAAWRQRSAWSVALLAEGVDRNTKGTVIITSLKVALLAEGVDRNNQVPRLDITRSRSPSSRRAWIEMFLAVPLLECWCVALLAEGVDRNTPTSRRPARS